MQKLPLSEWGAKLPVPVPGLPSRDFAFKPWKLEQEKIIGKLKSKNQHYAKLTRAIFNEMLVEVGGKAWASLKDNERELFLNQMPYANMMYMYIYLRLEALGEDLKMQTFACPKCTAKIKDFVADLRRLDVRIREDGDPVETEFVLKRPIKCGDVPVDKLVLRYTPWDAMERMDISDASNDGLVKETLMHHSLLAVFSTEMNQRVTLASPVVLKELAKLDIERYTAAIDEHNGGPILGLTCECPKCGHEIEQPLNWGYEYFFANSSL